MIEKHITITNEHGIHARPASLIVQTASKFQSSIKILKDDMIADAKSIMSIMMLAASCDSVVTIQVDGEDKHEAIIAIENLFKLKFNEE